MAELSIGEVAERTGLATSAIRYYEKEGLIPRVPRAGGQRRYTPQIVERIALIQLAQSAGFRIAEIKLLLSGFGRNTPPGQRWRSLADRKREELEARIAEAERMKEVLDAVVRCECPTFEDCASALCR